MRRRIERRACGGVPKKPLKKVRWRLVGWGRVSVQDLTRPAGGTRKGSCDWWVLTWKPVTLPTAWQGSSGQEGSGTVDVSPRTTVVRELVAAPAPAKSATSKARHPANDSAIVARPRRRSDSDPTVLSENLDMPML